MKHRLSKTFNEIFYTDLERPFHKARNTFDKIMQLNDELLRGEKNQNLHKCIREINDLIERCNFYPSKKSDDLINELYGIVTSASFYEDYVVDTKIVRKAHYLTLIYFKRVKELIIGHKNLSNKIDLFMKTLIVYVKLNIILQMSRISKSSHIKYYDFVFEHKPFELSVGIIEQIHIMYVYYEYLTKMNVYVTHSFENEINKCFEDIKAIVVKNNVPIDFEKYKIIKNRYEYVFDEGNPSNGIIDDYINVLLYDERARKRYIINQNFNFDGTSEERKTHFRQIFKKAEKMCLDFTPGKSDGLFGPVLDANISYDKDKSEFHFVFRININSNAFGQMYYINNLSSITIHYKYTKVNKETANKLLKKLKSDSEHLVEKGQKKWELFWFYTWFPFYTMNTISKDIDHSIGYEDREISDYYYVDDYYVEKVCHVFDMCEDVLYYKKSFCYNILLEVNNTVIKPQEKGSYYDEDYDGIWGENHCNWLEVVDTNYIWNYNE
ncbi:hypothetical protein [Vallitalea maricola]|uniref:Uncharacterized protein n=1 Tax=Vallitalea maricola TaxID=3074433 RepID=A0ACB5UPM6_9FIRM|nr:hypothetical protein AN2V17_30740 [Vallitalea sp. AN17-2]